MKEFCRLQRVPDFNRHRPNIPFSADLYRRFTFRPDYSNLEHRWALSRIYRNLIERDRRLQMLAYWELEKQGVTRVIHSFFRNRPASSFQPDLVDLYYLYAHVREHRPQTIVEFGSGVSTVVMAYALAQNGSGNLYAIERSPSWARSTSESIPEDFRKQTQVLAIPSVEVQVFGYSTFRFDSLPVDRAELVYIDGSARPEAIFQGAENLELLALRSGTHVYIDCRRNAVEYFVMRRDQDITCTYNIMSYMVLVEGHHKLDDCPFGGDFFANTCIHIE